MDEQREYKVENQRKFGQKNTDDKEKRQTQDSQGEMRKESNKEALSHVDQGEEEAKSERVSSLNKGMTKEEMLFPKKQNTNSSKQLWRDNGTKAEKRKLRSKHEEGEMKEISHLTDPPSLCILPPVFE